MSAPLSAISSFCRFWFPPDEVKPRKEEVVEGHPQTPDSDSKTETASSGDIAYRHFHSLLHPNPFMCKVKEKNNR